MAARRNTIRYMFRHADAPALFGDWRSAAAGAVADLRTVLDALSLLAIAADAAR